MSCDKEIKIPIDDNKKLSVVAYREELYTSIIKVAVEKKEKRATKKPKKKAATTKKSDGAKKKKAAGDAGGKKTCQKESSP